MTGINNFPNPSLVQDNMAISRKIHQQMMNKKHRWRPSELELAVLKLHFQKNQYPSKEEKEAILNSLDHQFGAKVHIDQLSRWFQHEREKAAKRNFKGNCKNTYRKFGKEELAYLQESFSKNNYPKMEEMTATAKRLNVNLSKIENWYKHNRRALAKRGHFSLKTKKYFKKEELSYLVEMFENHPRPTKEQFLEMAEKLNCSEPQIKNWYSNKRKKLKLIAKKRAYETTDPAFHETDVALFSKSNNYPEIPFQQPITGPIVTPQISGFPSGILEQKPLTSPFVLSTSINTLPGLQQGQPIYNGFTTNGIPVLVIPTTVSNSSSMIVNTNIINNSNAYPINSLNNPQDLPNSKEVNNFNIQKDLKKTLEPEKAKFMAPPPILYPFAQSNPLTYSFLPTASMIPIHTLNQTQTQMPIPNSTPTTESISNQWLRQVQSQKAELEIKPQQTLNINPSLLGANGLVVMNQNANNVTNAGNFPHGVVPVQINSGIPSYQTINGFPNSVNSSGVSNSDISNKLSHGINPVTTAPVSPHKPIQVQYQTSLYLPFSNNNIYSQYPPTMVQQRPEVYVQGTMQPQMNLSMGSVLPNGNVFGQR